MLGWLAKSLAAVALCVLAYEGYAVARAHQSLHERIAPFETGPAPLTAAQLDAVIQVQDPSFRSHSGVEWPSPLTTTTITQGLVKRLFFDGFKPGFQKLEQTLVAWWVVSPRVSKDTQLRAFTDIAYFGHKDGLAVVGFENAAKAWFGTPLASLSHEEFLTLTAMLPAPNALQPGSAASLERVARITRLLAGQCTHTTIQTIALNQCSASTASPTHNP